MEKVTYLIGAGASAGCIPVVNNMASHISNLLRMFDEKYKKDGADASLEDGIKKDIEKELMWLQAMCAEHISIDTYAKTVYLSKSDKSVQVLRRLKNILSLYFTLQQKIEATDKRYAHFWANILNEKDSFPGQIKILSWNYDSQFEISYGQSISSTLSLKEIGEKINVKTIYSDMETINPDQFNIFKLNGSAKILQKRKGEYQTSFLAADFDNKTFDGFFKSLFHSFLVLKPDTMKTEEESCFTEISFAWEHDFDTEYFTKIKNSIIDTTVLVVIGYSFPTFNRKVDKILINEFMPNLKKVYFQALPGQARDLMDRFRAFNNTISEGNIGLRENIDQFFIPNELDV